MTPSMRRALTVFLAAAAAGVAQPAVADTSYSIADGTAELAVSIDPNESMVWLNTFPVNPSGQWIDSIRIAYGRVGGPSALNGLPVTILLYEDQNGGSPQDAVLKWSLSTVIANGNTNTLNAYAVPSLHIQGTLVVGAAFDNASSLSKGVAALDSGLPTSAGRSYFGFDTTIDPANLGAITADQFGTIESFGVNGNFRIEAHGLASIDNAILSISKDAPSGSIHLSWPSFQSTYDVERGLRSDFADAAVVAAGISTTTYDDPVLGDGMSWFYRVR